MERNTSGFGRRDAATVGVFSVLYWLLTLYLAARKLLWFDEFFPYYISQLPDVIAIWNALREGTDPNPPLSYLITRASHKLFGSGCVATRLPSIAGFWLMSVCLYGFVRKRCSGSCALLGMAFPLATSAYLYAYDAKPYGLVLGWTGIALVCWQSAEHRNRTLALAGLGMSLAAAVSTHYYAVLLLPVFIIGEAIRSRSAGRIDWPVSISILAALVPLPFFAPLIESARGFAPHFWSNRIPSSPVSYYLTILGPSLGVLVWVGFLTGGRRSRGNGDEQGGSRGPGPTSHEIGVGLAFAALPLLTILVATLVSASATPRYCLASVAGFAILLAFGVSRKPTDLVMRVVAWLMIVSAVFLLTYSWNSRNPLAGAGELPLYYERPPFPLLVEWTKDQDLPIAVSDPNSFLVLRHYGPERVRPRLRYLADTEAAVRYIETDTMDRNLLALGRLAALPVEPYADFIAVHQRFFVCGFEGNKFEWLVDKLRADGAQLHMVARNGSEFLMEVRLESAESRYLP